MNEKHHRLITRPFQPFLKAADDLLHLARPHHEAIAKAWEHYRVNNVRLPIDPKSWQLEKSLSISSFMMSYIGLEALVNCIFEDFGVHAVKSLPQEYFGGQLSKVYKKIIKKPFGKLRLTTRLYLIAPLCTDPMIDPSSLFDIDSSKWRTLEEVVEIRHFFNHASSEEMRFDVKPIGEKLFEANDNFPDNFFPLTNVSKDCRTFNMSDAEKLNDSLNWALETIKQALSHKADDVYMTQEIVKLP